MNVYMLEKAAMDREVLSWRGQRVRIASFATEHSVRGPMACTKLEVELLDWQPTEGHPDERLVLPAPLDELGY